MVPVAFVSMEQLPLTSAMKIDLKALPEPAEAHFGKTHQHVEAENEIEAALVEIYKNVLSAPQVGVADDFFELGGESLSAMNVAAQVMERLGIEISVVEVLDNPSVRALAKAVEALCGPVAPAQVDDLSDDQVDAMLEELNKLNAKLSRD
jgi:acyl carrier protein